MKSVSGYDIVDTINLYGMERKPIDCVYTGTKVIKSEKLRKGASTLHEFHTLQDENIKFAAWGFGLLDSLLAGNEDLDRQPVSAGTPVRVMYKGKRSAMIDDVVQEVHDIQVFDISEEVKNKKITETKLDELVWL